MSSKDSVFLVHSLVFGISTLAFIAVTQCAKKTPHLKAKISVRDGSTNGLTVVTPSDSEFDAQLASILPGKEPEIRKLVDSANPFCMVLKNGNSVDLVGCRIEWTTTNAGGATVSQDQSYLNPGVLEGLEVSDRRLMGHTSLVNAHSSGLVFLDAHLHQFIDARLKGAQAGTLSALSEKDKSEIERWSRELIQHHGGIINSEAGITVSIKSAIFADGASMGSETDALILNTRALIDSRRELFKSIEGDIKSRKTPKEIFRRLELMEKQIEPRIESKVTDTENYENLYRHHTHLLIRELLDIRLAQGEGEAITYTQRPLLREWPVLRRVDSTSPK